MKRILVAITLILSLLLVIPMANISNVSADEGTSDNTSYKFVEVELEVEVAPPKPAPAPTPTPSPPTGNGVSPTYYADMTLFGIEGRFLIRDGEIVRTIEATSEDGILTVTIPKGTMAKDKDGKRLKGFEAAVDESPPDPPGGDHIIGLPYDFGPEGATFEPPITFAWSYDLDALPEGVVEEDLVLAYYDEEVGEWVKLDCVVDTENNVITASVPHFTTFAMIGAVTPPPPPAPVPPPPPPVVPPPEPPVVTIPEPVPVPAPVVLEPAPVPAPPEEEVPELPAPPSPNWPLIGGIIAGGIIVGLLIYFLVRRRAHLKIKGWLQRVKLPKRG